MDKIHWLSNITWARLPKCHSDGQKLVLFSAFQGLGTSECRFTCLQLFDHHCFRNAFPDQSQWGPVGFATPTPHFPAWCPYDRHCSLRGLWVAQTLANEPSATLRRPHACPAPFCPLRKIFLVNTALQFRCVCLWVGRLFRGVERCLGGVVPSGFPFRWGSAFHSLLS